MTDYDKLYIGGKWVAPSTDQVLEVFSPATEERVGSVPVAGPQDIDAAVAAARRAFDDGPWPRMSPTERAQVIAKAAKLLEERAADIAGVLSSEMGQPPASVQMMQVTPSLATINYFAGLADSFPWTEERSGAFGRSRVTREPVGVVAAVIAWNVPLFLAINKLGPAMLAGCTMVLKPAPESPLTTNIVGEIFTEAGLPEGVLSLVPGGAETGEYLVSHPDIDKITFTGSTAVGRKIGAIAAQNLKRCSLELGGKSAAIVLEDADLASTMPMLVMSGLMNTGQACVGQTRILAPRSRYDEVVEGMVATAAFFPVGLPSDPAAQLGPLISEKQRERVEGYIAKGKEEGARLVLGGGRPAGLETGYFVEPTIFADVDNSMTIAREEIFGPVLCVIPYDSVDEAIKIANDSDYGLAGSVYTTDVEKGLEVAAQVRTGTYGINWYAFDPGSPFGGYKNSGIGREDGPEGVEAFCETKSVLYPPGYTD
ncbi:MULTISPECIES: aldehyde dehydrogenase [Rhodococcus]|jgi:betaine-aldehyde dehydrogenase|uniref:aldehyde dehydrogenase (NAD(+)) n=1 Tax=Rhodococcus oxybenzonivorans TaxID=1990687 RepID=A0AAE4UYH1_9NOCA|nr:MULTISPECIES: aldehyde dehydrogenase [Rhodococcus]MDV7246436.1 aldehyde dehydrogenase [Rhodococcus oxybenzonivorans]MDV7265105.1 aldehyde dehydrogenase [Rhodococcus oxybenzonivorans]MDV7277975.1 aldehyde dehydrogenase [Rhodococcus oxybenzonivorans]MDV7337448.1 aldehyde dehydrogenase [Rhodococcus oxybenzonivorans]MDV7347553.1 aldehyde dehydrogenase [Rhodococcus oxybenzonivorans]